ncbi:MAG: hypothetical protein IKS61_01000 [Aeriscardovia sp.]|nr:hypothetical protein [Aeriscardovia sp.]
MKGRVIAEAKLSLGFWDRDPNVPENAQANTGHALTRLLKKEGTLENFTGE